MSITVLAPSRLSLLPLFLAGLLSLASPLYGQPTDRDAADRPPNVLLVISDDQGWGDVYSHGNSKLDTPVEDRLATQGARFDRFFVSPVCAPTRASLMTGRYFLRTGVSDVTRGLEAMDADEVTLAETFKQAGYATGIFGKWHLGSHYPHTPQGQGFDEFFGFLEGHYNNYYSPTLLHNRDTVQTDGYITDVLTDRTIQFIENNQDQPFFAYVPYNVPHAPYQVPERYYEKYKKRGLSDKTAAVYGMVDNMDENLGRLLNTLNQLDLQRETIVLFLGDNGPNGDRFNGGMRGHKGRMHEGGMRVPLFMRWPGHIPETKIVRPISAHIDLLPTLVELTGVEMPDTKPLDGRSLAPLLRDDEAPDDWPAGEKRTIFEHRGFARDGIEQFPAAVRTERYRLVCYDEPCMLFDMIQDPSQENNIASERPDVADSLRTAFDAWFEQMMTNNPAQRPRIPVGNDAAPTATLPAPEAYFAGDVSYIYNGYAHEWLTGWASPADSVWWEMDVQQPGRYAVQLAYTTPDGVSEVPVRLETTGDALETTLSPAGPHETRTREEYNPNRKRPVKDFPVRRVGTLRLEEGPQRLAVRLGEAVQQGGLDMQAVRLRRLE